MRRALRGVTELSLLPRPGRRENLSVHVVGLALLFLVPGMGLAALVEWRSTGSSGEMPLLGAALITAAVGVILFAGFRAPDDVRPADVFPVVVWTWLWCSVLGGLPYVLDADVFGWSQWDSALFESISGFTASGSTVLTDIDSHGRGLLLWRQLTQWYGGMGMVLLAVSVLPLLGVGGQELMRAETPGPQSDRLAPRISGTAKRLWLVYAGLTVAVAVALFAVPGVSLYDAVAHALTAAGTGGFSPYGGSIGHFESLGAELVMATGMIAGAMSFSLHYRALRGDWRAYGRARDQMLFLKILAAATMVITLLLWLRQGASFGLSLRDAFFNVVTLATSGGFHNIRPGGLGDFAAWTPPAQVVLGVLMLIGGGAGSTSGGMKVFPRPDLRRARPAHGPPGRQASLGRSGQAGRGGHPRVRGRAGTGLRDPLHHVLRGRDADRGVPRRRSGHRGIRRDQRHVQHGPGTGGGRSLLQLHGLRPPRPVGARRAHADRAPRDHRRLPRSRGDPAPRVPAPLGLGGRSPRARGGVRRRSWSRKGVSVE